MKKLTLSITLLFLFSTFLFAQEIKQKDKLNEETKAVKENHGIRSVGDKVLFKDGSTVLMEIENEGSAGSIVLPDVEGVLSGTKLYNWGGNLFWGGNQLGTAGSLGGWTRTGTYVHLTNIGDLVGIGTSNPNAKLDLQMSGAGFWQSGIRLLNYDLEAGNQLMFTLGADDVTKNAANIYFTYQGDASSQNRLSLGLHGVDDVLNIMADGNVGIGTTDPNAGLQVESDDGVLFTGTFSSGTIPAEGAGTRMMWYPAKAAFRAGHVTGPTYWDADNIGNYSFATGYNTTASGLFSTAMGISTIASGDYSTAMGYITEASSDYSTAMGLNTEASGWYSTAMGNSTTARGNSSTAMGLNTEASGYFSTAMGYNTTASGNSSTAMGREIEANGDGTVAIGLSGQNGLVVTQDNTMAIMGGNVGIGTTSPSEMLEVAGQLKITGGSPGAGKVLTSDATGLASWEGGYSIGDEAQGGIVFYVDASGKHGLACPTTDQSTGIKWSKTYTDILAYASSVGGGHLNTKLIVKDQGSSGDNYAALLCDGLSHDSYNDWYLPSKYELDLMYTNLHLEGLGGFASTSYWSSTEYSNILAWLQSFHMGTQDNYGKSEIRYVRAVRAF